MIAQYPREGNGKGRGGGRSAANYEEGIFIGFGATPLKEPWPLVENMFTGVRPTAVTEYIQLADDEQPDDSFQPAPQDQDGADIPEDVVQPFRASSKPEGSVSSLVDFYSGAAARHRHQSTFEEYDDDGKGEVGDPVSINRCQRRSARRAPRWRGRRAPEEPSANFLPDGRGGGVCCQRPPPLRGFVAGRRWIARQHRRE